MSVSVNWPARCLLALDVGNSRVKVGVFRDAAVAEGTLPVCLATWAVPWKDRCTTSDLLGPLQLRSAPGVTRIAAASVSPPGWERVLAAWPSAWPPPPPLLTYRDLPLQVHLEAPDKTGMDRLLNAVAGNCRRPPGVPLVIVDSGTATTVDYVSPAGGFEGGAILPGLLLAARALHEYTAQLPLLTPQELQAPPPPPLGKATRPALHSGVYWGQVGAIVELVDRLSSNAPVPPRVLVTGGAEPTLWPALTSARPYAWTRCPTLALEGLALAAPQT